MDATHISGQLSGLEEMTDGNALQLKDFAILNVNIMITSLPKIGNICITSSEKLKHKLYPDIFVLGV